MTTEGVEQLYMYLSAAWPLIVRPGADEEWKRAKVRELFQTYRNYGDEDVLEAFQKWTDENEKFPTTKNIINELKWLQVLRRGPAGDPAKRYQMERIYDDGNEYVVSCGGKINFTWEEFINLPCNPEHIDPEEWERRFKARRKAVRRRVYREAKGGAV